MEIMRDRIIAALRETRFWKAVWRPARGDSALYAGAAVLIGVIAIVIGVPTRAPNTIEGRIAATSEYVAGATEIPDALAAAARRARTDESRNRGAYVMYIDAIGDSLLMWREQNNSLNIAGAYPTGTRVKVLETNGRWSRVITPDAEWGWMETRYLSPFEPLVAGD